MKVCLATRPCDLRKIFVILYTVVENCRRLGIDARENPEDVLTRLPGLKENEMAILTPAQWLRGRQTKPLRKEA